jgi:hypothetical protein
MGGSNLSVHTIAVFGIAYQACPFFNPGGSARTAPSTIGTPASCAALNAP